MHSTGISHSIPVISTVTETVFMHRLLDFIQCNCKSCIRISQRRCVQVYVCLYRQQQYS